MKRREFIRLLGGAAAWPLAARAQQAALPVIGFLHSGGPGTNEGSVSAFRRGLADAGFIENKNVTIEFRWANLQPGQLPSLVSTS
jgi:putative ABC transport system substrate-binding protein